MIEKLAMSKFLTNDILKNRQETKQNCVAKRLGCDYIYYKESKPSIFFVLCMDDRLVAINRALFIAPH